MTIKIKHYYSDDHKHWEIQEFLYEKVIRIESEWQPLNGTKGSNWLIIYQSGKELEPEYMCFEQEDWYYDEMEIING